MIVVLDDAAPGAADQPQGLRGARARRAGRARRGLVRARRPRARARAARSGFDQLMAGDAGARRAPRERGRRRTAASGARSPGTTRSCATPTARRRDALLGRGRDGAPRGRAADHLPRLPRHAHRAGQPHAARGAPQARARPRRPHRRRRRAAARRPRPLQARQRLARPQRRRRADAAGSPRGCRSRSAPRTCSPAPAATASCCCSPTCTTTRSRPPSASRRRSAACLAEPFMVAGAEFQVTASIGIALSPRDAADAEALLGARRLRDVPGQGDRARRLGRLRARPARDPLERLSMAARLRRALLAGEFELHYQPIFAARRRARRRRGAAALARPASAASWCRRASSSRSPRRPGLIESIGDWVIGAVCAQQVEWAARGLDAADLGQRLAAPAAPRRLHRPRRGAPARERAPIPRG